MIIALSGPSGIGKGYVNKQLLQLYPSIEELVWFTTRPLRVNEGSGGNRRHISVSEFNRMVGLGELALVQNIFGNYYGIEKGSLLPSPGIKLTEVHPGNMHEALILNPDIIAIGFVTFEFTLLEERLSEVRKTETPAEIEDRVSMARLEIATIMVQQSLYASIVEITKSNEMCMLDKVLKVIGPYLKEES